jgi:hypothetical protein
VSWSSEPAAVQQATQLGNILDVPDTDDMAYQTTTRLYLASKNTPKTLGVRLGRLAVRNKLSVQDLALRTGASRTTIYSWFAGKGVTNAYKRTVEDLIKELRTK